MNANLISLERALLNLPSTSASDERTIIALIGAASDAVQAYCKRRFALTQYDEFYNGSGESRLLLREYPLHSVQSVRTNYQTVLRIKNTDNSTNQRATVAVTRDGLELVRVASGTVTVDTSVTWDANTTLTALASAINALSAGWSAEVVGNSDDFGKWPSADLYHPPSWGDGDESLGALDCRGRTAGLKLHTRELSDYAWDRRGWLVRANPLTDAELFFNDEPAFPVGVNNFRVQYTAGYTVLPEAVQEACAQWLSILFHMTTRDPALAIQAVPGVISQTWKQLVDISRPPNQIAALLAPYRRHSVFTNQG